jgi:hypothetical protein
MKNCNDTIGNRTRDLPACLLRTKLCRKDSLIALGALQILWTKTENLKATDIPQGPPSAANLEPLEWHFEDQDEQMLVDLKLNTS